MDLKELISSGILESYVLGTASREDVNILRALMSKHPELQLEIEAIEKTLLAEAEKNAPAINQQKKDALLSSISPGPPGSIVPLYPPRAALSPAYKYAIAASLALLIGSAIVNIVLYKQLGQVQQQVADLRQEKSVLAEQMQVNTVSLKETKDRLTFLSDTMVKTVHMKPVPKMPASMAMVYWNSQSKEVYLNVMELPAPPAGMQYQLWALADGKPVDAGVFSAVDTLQLQKLKDIQSAQAFAVTLEKMGGSDTPTMSGMYMMGTIQ